MNKIENLEVIVAQIMSAYGCSEANVLRLFEVTNDMTKGCRFASLKGYRSDVTENSENANHLVNLGFSYANMLAKDAELLRNFDITKADVDGFNYESIDTNGMTIEDYKAEVRSTLVKALEDINAPKNPDAPQKANNDVRINNILYWNTNTLRLSIIGESIKKEVTEKGEYKKVKSKALTIAKKIIKQSAQLRSEKYRRFCIDNLNVVNLQGETLEIS